MKLEVFVLILLWNCVSGNPVTEEENEVVELKDNAENVCIDQEVQNQIINITFIQSQVSMSALFERKMAQNY